MKLTIVLICCGIMYASASTFAQRVTLTARNLPLREVLDKIGNQTGYNILYNSFAIKRSDRVSVDIKNVTVEDALRSCLADQPFGYTITKQTIVVKPVAKVERKSVEKTVLSQNQQQTISGTVRDSINALVGVSVSVKGQATSGTTTDQEGRFTIAVTDANAVLIFKMLGYKQQEVRLARRTSVDVRLIEELAGLEEVVVIGYGTQRRADVTGAISKVGEKEIEERPIARVEQALQGQMAGVSVRSTSGSPGSDLAIRVRGAASIGGNATPLYVVDGVPLDNLSGINPSDITSIDVLKDASSAAIYGSRGSNGVILVSTKRGKIGKPVLSLAAYSALAAAERHVDVLSGEEWVDFNKKWLDRVWTNVSGQSADASQADRIAFAQNATNRTYSTRAELLGIRPTYGIYDPYWDTDAIEYIDWQDELLRTAPVNDIQLSASGANDMVNYAISGGVYDQEGIMVGSSFRRYSFRGNMEAKASKRVKIGLSIAPSSARLNGPNVEGNNNAVSRMLSIPGVVLAGSGRMAGAAPTKFYDGWGPGPNVVSPYVQAVEYDRLNNDVRVNSAFTTTVNVIEGLDINSLVGWNYRGNTQRTYSPTWAQPTWNTATPGELSRSTKTTLMSNSLLLQATANYVKETGNHFVNVLLGASQETFADETTDQAMTGFPDDKTYIFRLGRGTVNNTNTIFADRNGLISYFARVQYRYKNRYLFGGSVRADGSSRFGPNNRWGTFPALSAGWVLSEESFLDDINWLGTTKLRVTWGQSGNDRIGSSQFLSNMAALNYPLGSDQSIENGFVVGNIAYSDLRWEKTDSYNIGLDLGLLQDRITVSADVYYKKTTDLLLNAPVSLTTGFSSMFNNIGSVDNKGLELEIRSTNINTTDFQWTTSANFTINRNEITALSNSNADIRLGQGNTVIQRVGHPINSYFLLTATGVLRESDFTINNGTYTANVPIYSGQRPGDTKYMDINGDGKIDANDYSVAGNYQPDFEYGVTNSFNYKNFDLTILVNGRVGGDLLSIGSRSWNRATNDPRFNYMDSWLKDAYWSEQEPGDGKVPAFFSAVTSQYDTNWMYSAAYFRIRNINLGYTTNAFNKVFNTFRVYASCDNVFLSDSFYPGYSPEGATQDNASADWGSYPLARTFSLGVNLTF